MEGARPPPFNIFTITYKAEVYTPAERADTLLLCTLWYEQEISDPSISNTDLDPVAAKLRTRNYRNIGLEVSPNRQQWLFYQINLKM